ncbi:MAG: hypothetical protein JWM27_3100 [Gemmatimonadetes bacterium]|nr:hypothetical protein [Gemmatimonadota bacterium]
MAGTLLRVFPKRMKMTSPLTAAFEDEGHPCRGAPIRHDGRGNGGNPRSLTSGKMH